MARFSGKAGSISLGGSVAGVTKWDIDAKADTEDVTGMDSAGVKEFLATLTEWSGNFDAFPSGSITAYKPGSEFSTFTFASSGTSGAPKFTADVGPPAGKVIITGLKVSTDVKGVVQISCSFQGSGSLAWGTV